MVCNKKRKPVFIKRKWNRVIFSRATILSFQPVHLCRRVRPAPNKCSGYDTKQSNGEIPVMLELWGMWSTPSLPSLPGPLWSRVVAPERVLSMGQIEQNGILMLNWIAWNRTVLIFKLHTYAKLNCLKWNCFVCLTELFEIQLFLILKLYLC